MASYDSKESKIRDRQETDDANSVKTKLMQTWNNLKYDLSTSASLDRTSSIWLLGIHYYPKHKQSDFHSVHLSAFMHDFGSRPWFTYRKNFPILPGTNLTCDTGWGCMLRTAQMILAQGLINHFLGRSWRRTRLNKQEKIIRWFLDSPLDTCPFSIHHLTAIGNSYGNKAGSWYGPNTVAYILQDALRGAGHIECLKNVCITVAQDSTVYVDDVKELCGWIDKDNEIEDNKNGKAVIVLIPVRLGKTTLNPIYIESVHAIFTLDQSIGIIGGKTDHSVYFVGFQDENLIYLDPHYCQTADDPNNFTENIYRYHTTDLRKMNIKKLDPSCCFGFYCKNQHDFNKLRQNIYNIASPPKHQISYPMCTFVDGNIRDHYYCNDSKESNNICEKFFLPQTNNSTVATKKKADRTKLGFNFNKTLGSDSKLVKFVQNITTSTAATAHVSKEKPSKSSSISSIEKEFEIL